MKNINNDEIKNVFGGKEKEMCSCEDLEKRIFNLLSRIKKLENQHHEVHESMQQVKEIDKDLTKVEKDLNQMKRFPYLIYPRI